MVQTAFNTQSLPLTTSQGVVELLNSSENRDAYDQNCLTIAAANGGRLPQFFNNVVIFSGLYEELQDRFDLAEKQARLNEESKASSVVNEVVLPRVAPGKQATLNAQSIRVKPVMKP